ncbi:hypothetical protein NC99_21910 [Sunxiuqinia dokdonensis]|uniref:Uncharacterized protein n=1 Tax=Sunxiuqinia dokdonensis TaxID=1409788 RepID=A0A0L8V9E3_9BACT|nr:hypothetical protein NC99_21910 [Sunxiuqinia dokdonensis]
MSKYGSSLFFFDFAMMELFGRFLMRIFGCLKLHYFNNL